MSSRITLQAESVDDLKAEAVKSAIRLIEAAVLWHQAPGEWPHAKLLAAVDDWLHHYRRVCHHAGGVPTAAFLQHELALAAAGEGGAAKAAPPERAQVGKPAASGKGKPAAKRSTRKK